MDEPLSFCTRCGQPVNQYAPSTAASEEESSYWCHHCQRQWVALNTNLTGQLCSTCDRLVPLEFRYCGYCGNIASADDKTTIDADGSSPIESEPLILRIARVLTLIGDPPGRRVCPQAGDLIGSYDFWFDGGASIHHTGPNRQYDFADGTVAWESTKFGFGIRIRFSDGCESTVSLRRASHPGEVDL